MILDLPSFLLIRNEAVIGPLGAFPRLDCVDWQPQMLEVGH
jgi:hypothetical protein